MQPLGIPRADGVAGERGGRRLHAVAGDIECLFGGERDGMCSEYRRAKRGHKSREHHLPKAGRKAAQGDGRGDAQDGAQGGCVLFTQIFPLERKDFMLAQRTDHPQSTEHIADGGGDTRPGDSPPQPEH